MSARVVLLMVGGVALAVALYFVLGGTRQVAAPLLVPTASAPAPEPSTGAGPSADAADAERDQQATWAGHCDTLIGADVSEDCLAALDARFLDGEPYQLPGLAMQAALVEVPDAPTWREIFTDPLAMRARVFPDTPDLRTLFRQHDPRAMIDKMHDPSAPSLQWPHRDYEANVAARRRAAPATPRGTAPDAEFVAQVEVARPFDVLEVPGDHNRWETYSCDWSAEQRYEAHRLMGIAARLGNQWAMTQYRTQRLLDLRYRYDLREKHPVPWQVQSAKYHESPQRRAEAANLALSLAEELDMRIDRDRLLWLVGPASAAEADWEARAIEAFANVNSENSGDSPKPAESPATPQAKRP